MTAVLLKDLSGDPSLQRGEEGAGACKNPVVDSCRYESYNSGMIKCQTTSLRLSPEAQRFLRALADKAGVNMPERLAIMIRAQAQREDVK